MQLIGSVPINPDLLLFSKFPYRAEEEETCTYTHTHTYIYIDYFTYLI